jgi:hypothetical protein
VQLPCQDCHIVGACQAIYNDPWFIAHVVAEVAAEVWISLARPEYRKYLKDSLMSKNDATTSAGPQGEALARRREPVFDA